MLALMMAAMLAQAGVDREVRQAPPAVRAFISRRGNCNHFGGEEAYNAARARDIERALKSLRCDAIAADEKRLRRRYARQPRILLLLQRTDDMLGN